MYYQLPDSIGGVVINESFQFKKYIINDSFQFKKYTVIFQFKKYTVIDFNWIKIRKQNKILVSFLLLQSVFWVSAIKTLKLIISKSQFHYDLLYCFRSFPKLHTQKPYPHHPMDSLDFVAYFFIKDRNCTDQRPRAISQWTSFLLDKNCLHRLKSQLSCQRQLHHIQNQLSHPYVAPTLTPALIRKRKKR